MTQLDAAGRDVEHHEEQAEVEQRRAEVALEHDDRHRQRPDDEHRPEVARAREPHAEELACRPSTASRGRVTR